MSTPKRFEIPVRVQDSDIDPQRHINNVAFVRYIQDIAVAHWRAVAPAEMQTAFTWVIRRHEIDYLVPGLPGDELTVRTWVGEPGGATWERFTEIVRADGRVLVRSRTVWVLIDTSTGRPHRIEPEMVATLSENSK